MGLERGMGTGVAQAASLARCHRAKGSPAREMTSWSIASCRDIRGRLLMGNRSYRLSRKVELLYIPLRIHPWLRTNTTVRVEPNRIWGVEAELASQAAKAAIWKVALSWAWMAAWARERLLQVETAAWLKTKMICLCKTTFSILKKRRTKEPNHLRGPLRFTLAVTLGWTLSAEGRQWAPWTPSALEWITLLKWTASDRSSCKT